jgi:hypothetical protein
MIADSTASFRYQGKPNAEYALRIDDRFTVADLHRMTGSDAVCAVLLVHDRLSASVFVRAGRMPIPGRDVLTN